MGIFSKKKKEDSLIDEWGSKTLPYETNSKAMESHGVIPVLQRKKKAKSIQAIMIKIAVIAWIIILVLVMVAAVRSGARVSNLQKKVDQMQTISFDSRYSELGASIIKAYYAGQEAPVNLMKGVEWERKSDSREVSIAKPNVENLSLISVKNPAPSSSSAKNTVFVNPRSEVLVYSGMIDGKVYEFSVNLIIPDKDDYTNLPYLASVPSMLPASETILSEESNLDTPSDNPDSGYKKMSLNDSSLNTLTDWASAYAQDDRESLKRIVGDNDIRHAYHGIGGFSLVGSPMVLWSYQYDEGKDKDSGNDFIVARVQFNMTQSTSGTQSSDTQSEVIGNSSEEFIQTQTMDIMLNNFGAGSPDIVSWTPAGSWGMLKPYSNAVVIDLEENPDGEVEETSAVESTNPTSTQDVDAPTIDSSELIAPSSTDEEEEEETSTSKSKKSGKKDSSKKSKKTSTAKKPIKDGS